MPANVVAPPVDPDRPSLATLLLATETKDLPQAKQHTEAKQQDLAPQTAAPSLVARETPSVTRELPRRPTSAPASRPADPRHADLVTRLPN